MVKQTKFTFLPRHIDCLDQMIEEKEARTRQSAIEKVIDDKINEQKNRKALEAFHKTHY